MQGDTLVIEDHHHRAAISVAARLLSEIQAFDGKYTMTVFRPEWQRSMEFKFWSEGTEKSFLLMLSPAKDKGVTFLKINREMWNYIPKINRDIKIPPSMMLQSWMGSDFTNDDVVRADSIVVDYEHQIAAEPMEEGVAYWVIDCQPKEEAPVVWGRVRLKIQKENFVFNRAEYFDEENELIKYYQTSNVKAIEGRDIPLHFVMHDETNPGFSTTLIYDSLTFRPQLRNDQFSLRSLKR